MSRAAVAREADVRRAIKGAISAGLRPGEFEVRADAGGVRVITFANAKAAPPSEATNSWDSLHADG